MSGKDSNRPIIIKRKKIIKGGGHHGGAWKVAYADFVTAMMAFFLLMWLLNATTENQRKGLADYFSPTIPIHRVSGGGDGSFLGDSMFTQEEVLRVGTGATDMRATDGEIADGDTGVALVPERGGQDGEAEIKFTEIESMFRGDSGESDVADELLKHVFTRVTDDGLIIEIFELADSPLFVPGTAVPTQKMILLMDMIGDAINIVTNDIAVSGHTDIIPNDGGDAFDLSSDRAFFARGQLLETGIDTGRIVRVTGSADHDPSKPDADVFRNRRVEVTLLRRLAGDNTNN